MNPTESAGDFATIGMINERLQRYITRLDTDNANLKSRVSSQTMMIAELNSEIAEYESGDAVMKLRERIAELETRLQTAYDRMNTDLADTLANTNAIGIGDTTYLIIPLDK